MSSSNSLTSKLTFISLNVRGLNNKLKRQKIFRWIHNQKTDIAFLQESFSAKENEKLWANEWGGKIVFSHGTAHGKGVMMLFNPEADIDLEQTLLDQDGRYIMVNGRVNDNDVSLINLYSPNKRTEQVKFFKEIHKLAQENASGTVIIGGDCNISLTELDKTGGRPIDDKNYAIKEMQCLLKSFNLADVWREKNPNTRQYTWQNENIKCRLDYWFAPYNLVNLSECSIKVAPVPDHRAVIMTVKSPRYQKRGPGFWRLNNSLLEDQTFDKEMTDLLTNIKDKLKDIQQPGIQWEMIKMEIRSLSIQYSKNKARSRKNEEKELEEQLNSLMRETDEFDDPEKQKLICETKERLESIQTHKTKGAIIRSRCNWNEQGEKSTKYFFNLEKRNYKEKTISSLTLEDGSITTDPKTILLEEAEYYKKLYTSSYPDMKESTYFLDNDDVKKLNTEQKTSCDGEMKEVELRKALQAMSKNKNKSPGCDGITIEFYIKYWNLLKDYLLNTINDAYHNNLLPISLRRGVIRLIPKKGLDTSNLDNWRPISLLNVDYKIVSKALTLRIERLLPFLIHEDQTGFVKQRYIGTNIRRIYDTIDYYDKKKKPGLLMFLDFKKAYDSIEHSFILKVLETVNFGHNMIKWVKLLYTDITSCVLNNGYISPWFSVHRGVRQGDPLSSSLFIICIEMLASAVRADINIKGLQVYGRMQKLSMYADDMTSLLLDIPSALKLLETLNLFKDCSGLDLNYGKTEAMWIGSNKDRQDKPLPIRWPDGPIKALGAHFGHDRHRCYKEDLDKNYTKMVQACSIWKQRNLTLIGRILIVKTIGISKLIYICSDMHVPPQFVKQVNEYIFKYIWREKPPKVKMKTLIGKKCQGGLKMIDFNTMNKVLKAIWIKRFVMDPSKEKEHLFARWGGFLLFRCNYATSQLNLNDMPPFYKDVLVAWEEVMEYEPKTHKYVRKFCGIIDLF